MMKNTRFKKKIKSGETYQIKICTKYKMKSKISLVFEKCKKEKRAALITYTVAGDNTQKNSLKIFLARKKGIL